MIRWFLRLSILCFLLALSLSKAQFSCWLPFGEVAFKAWTAPGRAQANFQYGPTGGQLVSGTASTSNSLNTNSWQALLGADGNVWATLNNATGQNKQVWFDGVELYGSNKIIITVNDYYLTTPTNYVHQICDWATTTGVDNAADAQCTGGGWRTLQPLKTVYNTTAANTRTYEIYDGYFTVTSATSTIVSTPLSNFVNAANKRVLIRASSSVSNTAQQLMDYAQLEVGIDPVYEPAGMTIANASTTLTGTISRLVGSVTPGVTPLDGIRLIVPMKAVSTSVDMYFTFKNVKPYPGANSVLISPTIQVSNVGLTVQPFLYNFASSTWNAITATTTLAVAATDYEYAWSFNSATIGQFALNNYISSSTKDLRLRFVTNNPAAPYSISFDRIYLMIGSVNASSTQCEISWGTGTSTDCINTRDVAEVKTGTSTTPVWKASTTKEYPVAPDYYATDNDEDATGGENAFAMNLSFPINITATTSVSAIHYAAKFRSGTTSVTIDPKIRYYNGSIGNTDGWVPTPGADSSATFAYVWTDSWVNPELQSNAEGSVDTVNGLMNWRLRTSAASSTGATTTGDLDFAMMSVRYLDNPAQTSISHDFTPIGGVMATGTAVAKAQFLNNSWKALLGMDSAANGASEYWQIARTNPGGLSLLYYIDGVKLSGANKIIVTIKDANIVTADAYVHQICDWVSSSSVDNASDANCPGGWRTLNPRKATSSATADTIRKYHVYDGYFLNGTVAPGSKIMTPVSNFVSNDNARRVLLRTWSTVNSVTQYRVDYVMAESAKDSIYEPNDFTVATGTVSAGYWANIIGAPYADVTADDANRITIAQPSVSQPADIRLSFHNTELYAGANSILFTPKLCVSNVALAFDVKIYNFASSSWSTIATSASSTACTTDTDYAFVANSTTIPGFNINNYVSTNTDSRFTFEILTNAPVGPYNIQLNRVNAMVGSVNNDSAQCEISWGTGAATNCANTRVTKEAKVTTPSSTPWSVTTAIEYPANFYGLDNSDDGIDNEYAASQNMSFYFGTSSYQIMTALNYAFKYRSGTSTQTVKPQLRDYSGLAGVSGWADTPGADTSASAVYAWSDSWVYGEYATTPWSMINSNNGFVNMRLRTSAGTVANPAAVTHDLAFAMMAPRWVESDNMKPRIANLNLNNGANIILTNSTTTPVNLTAIVSDEQGWQDLKSFKAVIYRSGVTNAQNCTANSSNCYIVTSACATSSCSFNSCSVTCPVNMWYFADPTDGGNYAVAQGWTSQSWIGWLEATDNSNAKNSDWNYMQNIDVSTLSAINLSTSTINYGTTTPGAVSLEQWFDAVTVGNAPIDVNLSGSNMNYNANIINVGQQKYSLSTGFNWSVAGTALSTTPTLLTLVSGKPTADPSNASSSVYWKLSVPAVKAGSYTGSSTVTASQR